MNRASGSVRDLVDGLQELLARPDGSSDTFYIFYAPIAGEPVLTQLRTLEAVKTYLRQQMAEKSEGWYAMVRGQRWPLHVDSDRGLAVVQEPTGQQHPVLPEFGLADSPSMAVVIFPEEAGG